MSYFGYFLGLHRLCQPRGNISCTPWKMLMVQLLRKTMDLACACSLLTLLCLEMVSLGVKSKHMLQQYHLQRYAGG